MSAAFAALWSDFGKSPRRPTRMIVSSGASRVVPCGYRLADLVPPPRKHRHRPPIWNKPGVCAPNHKLRKAVTALAIANVGKQREVTTGGHGNDGHGSRDCCAAHHKPRSHDTSRIAWAKLMARVGEEFPFACPNCGGDIRLIAFKLFLPVRNHPWPSHCWQPPVAADILPAIQGRSGRSSRTWANPWCRPGKHRLRQPGTIAAGRRYRRLTLRHGSLWHGESGGTNALERIPRHPDTVDVTGASTGQTR
jgi:hypothetical protein